MKPTVVAFSRSYRKPSKDSRSTCKGYTTHMMSYDEISTNRGKCDLIQTNADTLSTKTWPNYRFGLRRCGLYICAHDSACRDKKDWEKTSEKRARIRRPGAISPVACIGKGKWIFATNPLRVCSSCSRRSNQQQQDHPERRGRPPHRATARGGNDGRMGEMLLKMVKNRLCLITFIIEIYVI